MKKISVLLMIVLTFNCSKAKKTECDNFKIPNSDEQITKVILKNQDQIIEEYVNQQSIDSTLQSLENGCLEFVIFGSHKTLSFYNKESLIFSIFINNKYFKYKGTTYKLKISESTKVSK